MNRYEDFKILTCSYRSGIHAGHWRPGYHSVAVRYKNREASMYLLDDKADAQATARLLLAELVARYGPTAILETDYAG